LPKKDDQEQNCSRLQRSEFPFSGRTKYEKKKKGVFTFDLKPARNDDFGIAKGVRASIHENPVARGIGSVN
jgi:hypothetical protein